MNATHIQKQTSVARYAEFIKKHANKYIDLRKALEDFRSHYDGKGIGQGIRAWEESIAIPYADGTHKITCSDPYEDAKLVLQRRHEIYNARQNNGIEEAITLLKSKGYKIFAPKVEYTEI